MARSILLGLSLAILAAVACLGGTATPAHAEKRVALVIGNDHYPNLTPDQQLEKAVNDAEAVGDAYARLGFEVIRGRNLGRQQMIDKLADLTAKLQPGDIAAFFYAGHGVAIGGANYLVPSDVPRVTPEAESRVRGASLAELDVVSEIQSRGVRVAFLVIDACRDNPFPKTGTRAIGNTRGLADAKPVRGVFTLYSAGIGQSALDKLERNDRDRNSVFTRIFLQELVKPQHLGDLAVEVREKVAELALKRRADDGQVVGHEQTPAYYDQTLGGRIFLTRAVGIEPAKPAPAKPAPAPSAVVPAPPPPFAALPSPSPQPAPPPLTPATPGVIKVAIAGPLTGTLAAFGLQMRRGAELAAEEINAAGGILGRRIVLEFADDGASPDKATLVANSLAQNGTQFVIGHFNSSLSLVASTIYEKAGIVMITPAATNPRITERGMWNVFRTCGRDDQQAGVAAEHVMRNFGRKRIAVLSDTTSYGTGLAEQFRKEINAAGIREVLFESVQLATLDFSGVIAKLRAQRTELIYWGGLHRELALLIKQARAVGVSIPAIAADGIATDEFAKDGGPGVEGTLMTFGADPRLRPEARQAVAKFRARKIEPEGFTLNAYAALEVIRQAAEAAQSLDPKRVASQLRSGQRLKTVVGDISYDAKGDLTQPDYVMYVWRKGSDGRIGYFQR